MKKFHFFAKQSIVLAITFGLALIGCSQTPFFEDEYQRFESVKVGMSEEEVTATLGKPLHVYSKADAPESYYVEGYSFRKREITNKVLIFRATEAIAYVYLDHKNEVEKVFVGGS
ncbi:MAG: outer membrane protein assembly factor BamE [Pirellulales bacterium]